MRAPAIEIPWTADAQRTLEKLQAMPALLRRAVTTGMNRAAPEVVSMIQRERLLGEGPFPVEEHRLGQRTSKLTQSTYHTPAETEGARTTMRIGSPMPYASVHEFGFNGQVHVPSFTRKRAKQLVKEERVSKKTGRSYVSRRMVSLGTQTVRAHTRWMAQPARAPFGHGLADHARIFTREIEVEVMAEWNGGPR